VRAGLVAVIAVSAAVVMFLVRREGVAGHDAGWLPWAFCAMAGFSAFTVLFDKEQKVDAHSGPRTQAVVLLLGPMGARFVFALLGGCFGGRGIALLL
jgi:hypothetical protein